MVESDPRSRGSRLLVLGAGPAQLGLLEAAQKRGLWLAVVDRDTTAPGFRFASRRCILSTEDEPAIERLASALEIDGIISPGTDWPVAVAARIAERLGLPHPIDPATAVVATNKIRQRERLVGWTARTSFEDGLERTVAWYRENEAWWRAILARGAAAYSS